MKQGNQVCKKCNKKYRGGKSLLCKDCRSERDEHIRGLYFNQDLSVDRIAEMENISPPHISFIVRRSKKLRDRRVISLWQSGMRPTDIAREVGGLSPSTISIIICREFPYETEKEKNKVTVGELHPCGIPKPGWTGCVHGGHCAASGCCDAFAATVKIHPELHLLGGTKHASGRHSRA